jgi:putative ABC transport system permease protein
VCCKIFDSPSELRKKPGLALTAIFSLALGIGATTAVFSVIYGLLANPYPYQGAARMIHLQLQPR